MSGDPQPKAKLPQVRPALSENTVNRMLDAQTRDQELRAQELTIRQDELKAQSEFAHKMLQAQVTDRDGERKHFGGLLKIKMIVAVTLALISAGVITYWLHLGKDQLASDVTKMLISAAFGAFGGYGYRSAQGKSKDKSDSDEE